MDMYTKGKRREGEITVEYLKLNKNTVILLRGDVLPRSVGGGTCLPEKCVELANKVLFNFYPSQVPVFNSFLSDKEFLS